MKERKIDSGWRLLQCEPGVGNSWLTLEKAFGDAEKTGEDCYELTAFPAQVHDVLLAYGRIKNPNIQGINEDLWIEEADWAYRTEFYAQAGPESQLVLQGVDTFADVWLNGVQVGSCENPFMEYSFDITGALQEKNILIVFFHSAKRMVEKIVLPEKYGGLVPDISAARIFRSGFHEYCGPVPRLIRCGLYADVWCRQIEKMAVKELKTECILAETYENASVEISAVFEGDFSGETWEAVLYDAAGRPAGRGCQKIKQQTQTMTLDVKEPELWWPWTHGTPTLYTLKVSCGGADGEQIVRKIGFRRAEQKAKLQFTINGQPVRLWGVNLTHPDTLTNCYDREKMNRLLDLVQLSYSNTIRVWGESEKYPEEFYEACDRRGILLWQDFYLCCSMYSEEPDFLEVCRQEAVQMVKRLRHHPSILLWCGGNELYLARDYGHPESSCFGEKIVKEIYPEVCAQLDEKRYYHVSSPYGGDWANDPSVGDTHGYTHLWYVPGRAYPVFLSENCRVSTPAYRTMKRMMTPEELWPCGYRTGITKRNRLEWPASWSRHNTNEGWKKLGPVEHYPEAENAEELIYRIGAAHAEYIREQVSRFRRGYSAEAGGNARVTGGHLLWKLNNNSNIISYGVVDYFLEPYYPYYEMRRCYQPFFVSCELGNHGYVWLTNDTTQRMTGKVEVFLFHLEENRVTKQFCTEFSVEPDESCPICTLDAFGQFRKENIVCIRAYQTDGSLLGESLNACEIERKIKYPEHTGLEIVQEGEELVVTAKAYARCVELTGSKEGDCFGWLFADNYFDLLPGMRKRIRVYGRHKKGTVTAKAFYDETATSCTFQNGGN